MKEDNNELNDEEMKKELDNAIDMYEKQKFGALFAKCILNNNKNQYFYEVVDLILHTTKMQKALLENKGEEYYSEGANLLRQFNQLLEDYLNQYK